MSKLLTNGTKVLVNCKQRQRNYENEKGTITSVDTIDNRTIFPYGVTFPDGNFSWFKESEIAETPPEPDRATLLLIIAFIIGMAIVIGGLCYSQRDTTKQDVERYNLQQNSATDSIPAP